MNYLRYLFTMGVLPEHSSSEKRDIIFTNQAIFVLILSSVCIAIANFIAGCYWRVLVPLTTFCCLLSTYHFQHRLDYKKAKFFAIFFPFLAAICSTILFGPLAKTQFYMGATLVLGIILFEKTTSHALIFFFHFIGIVSIQYFVINGQPFIPDQDSFRLGVFNICFIGICIYITLSQFKVHYHKYEEKFNLLLKSVKEQSEVLKTKNQQIKKQSEKLQEINISLEKEMTEKLSVQKQLLNSNEELERFAYVASHDLKEPLRTIGSFTQILQKQLEPKSNPDEKEYFYFVVDGVKRMSVLLDDLLALSRLNREFTIAPLNLNNLLELVNLNLRNLISKNNGQLIVDPLPTISGNKTQIIQLFQNLVSNGFKFKGKDDSKVEIFYRELEHFHEFEIRDNGIGISPKYQEQIFIIFKRLHTRDKYTGTGIGLAICKKVVKNHGGKIWLKSQEGIGSSFFFTLKKEKNTKNNALEQKMLVEAQ